MVINKRRRLLALEILRFSGPCTKIPLRAFCMIFLKLDNAKKLWRRYSMMKRQRRNCEEYYRRLYYVVNGVVLELEDVRVLEEKEVGSR